MFPFWSSQIDTKKNQQWPGLLVMFKDGGFYPQMLEHHLKVQILFENPTKKQNLSDDPFKLPF